MSVDTYNCDDPGYDSQFCRSARCSARPAILAAKSKIIRFISQEMTAADQLQCPGTDLNKQLGADLEALQDKLDAQRPKLVAMLREIDKDAAANLEDAGTKELPNLVISAVKTLDKHFAGAAKKAAEKETDAKDAKPVEPAGKADAAMAAEYDKVRQTARRP